MFRSYLWLLLLIICCWQCVDMHRDDSQRFLVDSSCFNEYPSSKEKGPTCKDLKKNQDETDIDCGGKKCSLCADGKKCLVDCDCISDLCKNDRCARQSTEATRKPTTKATKSTMPASTTGTQSATATVAQTTTTISTEPTTTTGTQPATATGTHLAIGTGTHPATRIGTHPATRTGTQPTSTTSRQTITTTGAQPTTATGTHSATGTGTQRTIATGTHPATGTGTQPTSSTGTQPTTTRGTQSATTAGTQTTTTVSTQSATTTGAQPTTTAGTQTTTTISTQPTTTIGTQSATTAGTQSATTTGAQATTTISTESTTKTGPQATTTISTESATITGAETTTITEEEITTTALPTCDPECQNSGTCSSHNSCTCTTDFSGPTCDVQSIGLCLDNETLGVEPILLITFGNGSGQFSNAAPAQFNFSTTYAQRLEPPIEVGQFGFINSIYNHYDAWHTGATDHTGDIGGYMYVVNANSEPGQFYSGTVDNLCVGLRYEFSVYLANVCKKQGRIEPNVLFEVRSVDGNQLLAQLDSGNIPERDTLTWEKYGFSFIATGSSVNLLMISNARGDNGNDIAIDDIALRVCAYEGEGFCPPENRETF